MAAGSLTARALRLLALREHSRAELERRLGTPRRGEPAPDPAEVAAVLDALQARGLLDERRFAESLVRRRSAKYGPQRIARELRSHGIEPPAPPPADDEAASALRALRRRHPNPPADAREFARQYRFLQARGFSADAIRRALAGTAGPVANCDE